MKKLGLNSVQAENSKFYKSNFKDGGALSLRLFFLYFFCPYMTP